MTSLAEKIKKYSVEAEQNWGKSFPLFAQVVLARQLKVGAELGIAFGGHSEHLLKNTSVEKIYGVDPYRHFSDYNDPMNVSQDEFDELYRFVLERFSPYGERYQHIRDISKLAVQQIETPIDFVYIDADHSYQDVFDDLCTWFSKVREGGIIGGHDYNHPNSPGVSLAVDNFFHRFNWEIHEEGEGVWWVEKSPIHITYFIPAYNCEKTLYESVQSIMKGNFVLGDELILVDDGSTDNTAAVLESIHTEYPDTRVIEHPRNKGGAAARNTAVEAAQHPLLFCLDSDNVLVEQSIPLLLASLIEAGADIAAFQEIHFFQPIPSPIRMN